MSAVGNCWTSADDNYHDDTPTTWPSVLRYVRSIGHTVSNSQRIFSDALTMMISVCHKIHPPRALRSEHSPIEPASGPQWLCTIIIICSPIGLQPAIASDTANTIASRR